MDLNHCARCDRLLRRCTLKTPCQNCLKSKPRLFTVSIGNVTGLGLNPHWCTPHSSVPNFKRRQLAMATSCTARLLCVEVEVPLISADLVCCRAYRHNVYRLHHVGLGNRTRSMCKQWDVRMAAGSRLSFRPMEPAMDRALVLFLGVLLRFPRHQRYRCRLVFSVHRATRQLVWSDVRGCVCLRLGLGYVTLSALMLCCCSCFNVGEVSCRRLSNPRLSGLPTWPVGLSVVAPAPIFSLPRQLR